MKFTFMFAFGKRKVRVSGADMFSPFSTAHLELDRGKFSASERIECDFGKSLRSNER